MFLTIETFYNSFHFQAMRLIKIQIANKNHLIYAKEISEMLYISTKMRGTGIAVRKPAYIESKIKNGNAIIAIHGNLLVGFCYIEVCDQGEYIAHSGLIAHPNYRNQGLAKRIKKSILKLSLEKYPNSKSFGITTELAVMKINSDLGYKPVTFSEITNDSSFWEKCKTCTNYKILTRKKHKMCLCNGMLYNPKEKSKEKKKDSLE